MNLAAVREQIKPRGPSSWQSGETDSIFQPLHSSHFADEQDYEIIFAQTPRGALVPKLRIWQMTFKTE